MKKIKGFIDMEKIVKYNIPCVCAATYCSDKPEYFFEITINEFVKNAKKNWRLY